MKMGSGRQMAVIGAASSIGIRPYDEQDKPRQLDRAPGVLRRFGLVQRLGAEDLGDVTPPPYRDFIRPPGGVRNEAELSEYNRSLADRVAAAASDGAFTLVLGGDCSIVLGSLLGATRAASNVGLAYIDAHADFAAPEQSLTGSAASMCLALAVGRGDSPLARLGGPQPLVRADHVVLVGRRDEGQSYYGHDALASSGILDLTGSVVSSRSAGDITAAALARLSTLDGLWIHVDADVLNPEVMPAVDSPEPGGPGISELAAILVPLAHHPRALGMQITIYDPGLDADRSCAARIVTLLEKVFAPGSNGDSGRAS